MKFYLKFIIITFFGFLFCLGCYPAFAEPNIFTNKLGMRFILIPSGNFLMGSPKSEKGRQWNEKRHKVVISKSFYMGETEVTQDQWKKLVG